MNTTSNDDPAAIERDIRQTQEDMSRTVDKLGSQLTAKNLFNSLLDKADENGIDAQYLIDGARRNPMALGLIAAGAIWLVSDKDSKFPSLPRRSKGSSDGGENFDSDVHHRDYVSHMSGFDMREGEEPAAYQRRRDLHRASFLMCEPQLNEDEHSFRQRLDELTDAFRQKRRAWMDSTSQGASATRDGAQRVVGEISGRAQGLYENNPLVGGILAAAVGAALGSAIPVSRVEQDKLGALGAKARDLAGEQKDQLAETLSEKKDELLEKVDQKLQVSQPESTTGRHNEDTSFLVSGDEARNRPPFITAE